MLALLFFLAGGLALLYVGAELLVRGGVRMALRFGLSPLVIGLTVVAFGTSSPELVVSLQAALQGNEAIAVGNVVGSNICNVALILGLSALLRPLRVHHQLLRLDVPLMIVISGLLAALLLDGHLGRLEGGVLVAGIVGYVALSLHLARRPSHIEELPAITSQPGHLALDILLVAAGLGLLMLGSDWLVTGAIDVAERAGLSKAVVGLTVVAVGTSLPELATSVVAALRGEGDIALGNVIGSNLFNILGILGISAFVHPLNTGGVVMTDLLVMTGIALLALPLMRTGFLLNRWEGALFLAIYIGYVAYLLP